MSSVFARFTLIEVTRTHCSMGGQDGKWGVVEGVRVKLLPNMNRPFNPTAADSGLEMTTADPVVAKMLLDAPLGQELDIFVSLAQESK